MRATGILPKMALLLAVIVLFQSCTVYKNNVTIEEAVNANTITKVRFDDGNKRVYKKIHLSDNGHYYGVFKERFQGVLHEHQIQINEDKIQRISIKNKTATIVVNVLLPLLVVTILISSFSTNCCGPGG